MTIYRILTSIRRFGLRGIYEWLTRKCRPSFDPITQSLRAHIVKGITQTKGITIIADMPLDTSLGKVLSDLASSLRDVNIPHQVCDLTKPLSQNFIVNRYTDIITMFRDIRLKNLSPCRIHRIVFWEFDTGFAEAHPDCVDGSPLLAFSTYCHRILRTQIHPRTQLEYLRYPFHFSATHTMDRVTIRTRFNIPLDAFVVFFNFDYRSSYYRKNPEGLLAAFEEAFSDVPKAILVFKTNGHKAKTEMKNKLEKLVQLSSVSSRVRFIDDFISVDELVSLTATCDVYASLHRGEGFGLGVAEAMSLGKPVVVSDCGATNEFCSPDTALLVPHRTVKVKPDQIDHPDYTWVGQWPDPDFHVAAKALRDLYNDPNLRYRLGMKGRQFIAEHFSTDNFQKTLRAFFRPC